MSNRSIRERDVNWPIDDQISSQAEGWDLFYVDGSEDEERNGTFEIETITHLDLFLTDEAAMAFVVGLAKLGSERHQRALALHGKFMIFESHAKHAERLLLVTPCAAWHMTFYGRCLNCGYAPPWA